MEHMARRLQDWFADWVALGLFCHPQAGAQCGARSSQASQLAA
jgi:hypothetical protein